MSDLNKETWEQVADRMLGNILARRALAGLIGLSEVDAQDRIAALMRLDGKVFDAVLAIENDGVREARLLSLTRGYQADKRAGGGARDPETKLTQVELDDFLDHYARHRDCPGIHKCPQWAGVGEGDGVAPPPAPQDKRKGTSDRRCACGRRIANPNHAQCNECWRRQGGKREVS